MENKTTTDTLPEGSGAILWTLIGLVIWVCLATGIWLYLNKQEEVKSYVVPKAISDRMKYHGVSVVYVDWKGNEYFIRDGKRCKF